MHQRIFALLAFIVIFSAAKMNAQSAVYFCSLTGEYGFCYGEETEMKARECAYTNCVKAGGTQPVVEDYTTRKGFGAICIGEDYLGNTVIGVALGYDTQSEADKAAQDQCSLRGGYKMRIREQWEDR